MRPVYLLSNAVNYAKDAERELADVERLRSGEKPKIKISEKS